jgi:hypothetical protein
MKINSYAEEKEKGYPAGSYSLYSMDPVHEGMTWGTATVTLTQWLDKPPTNSKYRLSRIKFAAKFIVQRDKLSWQLPLLEQVLYFANKGKLLHQGKIDLVFRFIESRRAKSGNYYARHTSQAIISNQRDWNCLESNCTLLKRDEALEVRNG